MNNADADADDADADADDADADADAPPRASRPTTKGPAKDDDMQEVVRPGDPGIDARWLRLRGLGLAVSSTWPLAATLAIGVMTASRIGPPGWIQAWQIRDHGVANPLLAALPLMPLALLPRLAGLMAADVTRPVLLGMQQAWKPNTGPRVEWSADHLRRRSSRTLKASLAVLVLGLAALAAGLGSIWTNATQPVRPPVQTSYGDLIAGRAPDALVLVTGADEGDARWIESTRMRTNTVRNEWRELHAHGSTSATSLVERIDVDVDALGRTRELARPGLVGRIESLDTWHADLLRRQGFALGGHVKVLRRSISADTDGIDKNDRGILMALGGFVATFMGGVFVFAIRRGIAAREDATAARRRG